MQEYTLQLTDERAAAIIAKQGGLEYLQTYCDQFGDMCVSKVNDDIRSGLINRVREGLTNEEMLFLASLSLEQLKVKIAEMKGE